jgi:hypothetical protein
LLADPAGIFGTAERLIKVGFVCLPYVGADYVFFGTVLPSRSHPRRPTSGIAGVAAVASAVSNPVISIGGIVTKNCKSVIDTGAVGVVVIGAIIGEDDSYGRRVFCNRRWQAADRTHGSGSIEMALVISEPGALRANDRNHCKRKCLRT